jgi:FixJ family two-component response regulator
MEASPATVYLVDDDPAVLKALARLLRGQGWSTTAYASAEAFLAALTPEAAGPAALVLDVGLPGLDGLELQRRLGSRVEAMPVVFLTGRGDIPMSVKAMKAGAVNFLTKPVSGEVLIAAVREALAGAASRLAAQAHRLAAEDEIADFRRLLATLTERERQVLEAVASGRLNKQIAGDLGIVEQTVKFHRARMMQRMQARTAAELMQIAARLGIPARAPPTADTGTAQPQSELQARPRPDR